MANYNERLFSSGFRGWLHTGRFQWLRKATQSIDVSSVFELGCFDAKSISYLPRKPDRYLGVDADWEGGLTAAREAWPQYEFLKCTSPDDLASVDGPFACSICMDTFEHIPVEMVDGYVDQLARLTEKRLVVTVPVEKGPIFLGKYVSKRLSGSLSEHDAEVGTFTTAEVINATLGRCDRVKRGEHKGFDYAWLVRRLSRRFTISTYEGYPFAWLPRVTNFGVCILAEPKPNLVGLPRGGCPVSC